MRRVAAALLLWAVPAGAQDFRVQWPVACTQGRDCFIQNYVDRDPGPAARDFTCGPLTYDTHTGTDIAVATRVEMERGVAVLAAAPGRVVGTRNSEPDISIRAPDAPDRQGRDCGNGVRLDHGGGWETQYCHLRRGSIAVRVGQEVQAGEKLGLIGLSGKTEFPHVHFQIERDRRPVDPFDSAPAQAACGAGGPSMWADAVTYVPTGVVAAGVVGAQVGNAQIDSGEYRSLTPQANSPVLAGFVQFFGVRRGDVVELSMSGPAGFAVSSAPVLERDQARAMRLVGRRLTAPRWPAGDYRLSYRLMRDGAAVASGTVSGAVP